MNGSLVVDGVDVYQKFGVWIADGGYAGLVSFPPLKPVEQNDWHEEDGLEVDLSEPMLDCREFSIVFYANSALVAGGFLAMLSNGAYHEFEFNEIGLNKQLRLVTQASRLTFGESGKFTLQFADDAPLAGYEYSEPIAGFVPPMGYEIDGVCLSNYGVAILNGTDDAIFSSSAVKRNLLVSNPAGAGVVYDGERVTFQAKEVPLKLLFEAQSKQAFWTNFYAFLFDLIKPGERALYVERAGVEYPFYYKNATTTRFERIGERMLCEVSIMVVFTTFRVQGVEYVLTSELDEVIVDESGLITIDVEEYGIS